MKKFYKVLIEDLEGWGEDDEKFFTSLGAAREYAGQQAFEALKDGAVLADGVPKDDLVSTADKWGTEELAKIFVEGTVLYKKLAEPVRTLTGDLVTEDGEVIAEGREWDSHYSALRFQIFEFRIAHI